jgi:hypothetical protein
MRLVHWSADIVTSVHGRRQIDAADPRNGSRSLPGKPQGFWLSDESRGAYGWRSWCRAERFRTYAMRYEHEVELVPNAKILYLRTAGDIDKFTAKFGYSLLDLIAEANGEPSFNSRHPYGGPMYDGIHWKKVAAKYHGIIITPYIWSRRLELSSQWYYGWDCASGVIWNARAVAGIRLVKEHKAPKKPTYWQRRRAHKRDIARMVEATEQLKELNNKRKLQEAEL